MATGEILEVGAVINLGQIMPGLDKMATGMQTTAASMKTSMEGVNTTAAAMSQTVAQSLKTQGDSAEHAAQVYKPTALSMKTSMEGVNATAIAMSRTVAQSLQMQGSSAADAAQVYKQLGWSGMKAESEIAAAFGGMGAAAMGVGPPLDTVPPKTRRVMTEATEARHALRGMGEMMGVGVPRHISSFIASLEGIGPVFARAFSVIAIIGIAQLLMQLAEKIGSVKDAILGWGEAAKKAYADAIDANLRMIHLNVEHEVAVARLGEIGKAGIGKITAEQRTLQVQTAATGRELAFLQGRLTDIEHQRKFMVHPWGFLTRSSEEIKRLEENIARLKARAAELEPSLRFKLPEKRAELGGQTTEEARKEQMALEEARLSAEKTVGLARVGYATEIAHERLRAGTLTQAEETATLVTLEEQKLAIERRYIAGSIALTREREEATGKPEVDKITALNAQRVAVEIEAQTRISAIRAAGVEVEKRQAIDLAAADISSRRSTVEAQASIEEDWINRERAERRVSIDQQTDMLRTAETTRYETQRSALVDRLALAVIEPEKNRALMLTLGGDIERLEIEHNARLTAISANGQRERIDLVQSALEEEASATKAVADRELETVQHGAEMRRRSHQISISEWESVELEALNRWYEEQSAVTVRVLSLNAERYGLDSLEYQRALNRKSELDQEYASKAQAVQERIRATQEQMISQVDAMFGRSVASILSGQEDLASGFKRIYANIQNAAISMLLRMGERWLFQQTFMKSVSELFGAGEQARNVTRAAQRVATESATDSVIVAQRVAMGVRTIAVESTEAAAHVGKVTARAVATTVGQTVETTAVASGAATRMGVESIETGGHIGQVATRTAATTAGQATETGVTAAGSVARTAFGVFEALASIVRSAAVGAANAFRSVMEVVPFPFNIAIAAGVAAGVFGAIKAFGAIASAAGGMEVTHDQLVQVHERETILPADLSAGFRNIIAAGAFSAPVVMARGQQPAGVAPAAASHWSEAPVVQLSYAPQLRAVDMRGMRELLDEHADHLSAMMGRAMRQGRLRPSYESL